MENPQVFPGQHKFTRIVTLITAFLLVLIAFWPAQARGQTEDEQQWIRPPLVESARIPLPTTRTRA